MRMRTAAWSLLSPEARLRPRPRVGDTGRVARSAQAGEVQTLLGILRNAPISPRPTPMWQRSAIRRLRRNLGPGRAFAAARYIDLLRPASRSAERFRNSEHATSDRHVRHGWIVCERELRAAQPSREMREGALRSGCKVRLGRTDRGMGQHISPAPAKIIGTNAMT